MKVVMTQELCPQGMEALQTSGLPVEFYVAGDGDPRHYLPQLQQADAFIIRVGSCQGEILDQCPNLKVIGRTGVGYDTVDLAKATSMGIPVVITPGANSRSVAEHALALMFALAKNLCQAQEEMRRGNWGIRDAGRAFQLEGKRVGILGLGAIGSQTAGLCRALGMKVAGYTPNLTPQRARQLGVIPYPDYRALLRDADVVILHLPLTPDTRNMIAAPELALMKKNALLINCSRGGIVNEGDLCAALARGDIGGAATDVFAREPLSPQDPLLQAPNLLVSPHAAALTREAVVQAARQCVEGCLAVLRGESWPHVADPAVYLHPRWQKQN